MTLPEIASLSASGFMFLVGVYCYVQVRKLNTLKYKVLESYMARQEFIQQAILEIELEIKKIIIILTQYAGKK